MEAGPGSDESGHEAQGAVVRIVRSGFWSVLSYLAVAVSTFGVGVVVARALGAEDFGEFSYYQWIVRVVPEVLALGVPLTFTRLVAEELATGREERGRGLLSYGTGVHGLLAPIAASVAAVAVWSAEGDAVLTAAIGAGVVAVFLSQDLEAGLTARLRIRHLSQIGMVVSVLQLAAAAVAAVADVRWEVFVATQVGALLVGTVLQTWALRHDLSLRAARALEKVHRRRFLKYAAVLAVTPAITAVVWGRPELYFLLRYDGEEAVGLYSAGLRLSSIVSFLPIVAGRAVIPEFSSLHGRGERAALEQTFRDTSRLLFALSALLASVGVALTLPALELVYGGEFGAASGPTAILFAGGVATALSAPASATVLLADRPRVFTQIGLAAVAANLALDVLLIPPFGLTGAAVATVAVQGSAVAASLVYSDVKLGFRLPLGSLLAVIAVSLVTAGAAWTVSEQLGGVVGLLAGGVVGVAVYLGGSFATGTLRADDLRPLLGGRS